MEKYICFLWLLVLGTLVNGQTPDEIVLSNSVLYTNFKVVKEPGSKPKSLDILVENGLIKQISNSIEKTSSATVIDGGDSLFIYPSFILPYTTEGIKEEKESGDEPVEYYTPNKEAWESIRDQSSAFDGWRKAGFGLAVAYPKGYIVPGQGNLIILKKELVRLPTMTKMPLHGQYRYARKQFPATQMGVMASLREKFTQARYAQKHQTDFNNKKPNISVPQYQADCLGLLDVANGKQNFLFNTPSSLHISRTLNIQKDLNIPMIFNHVSGVAPFVDRLKAQTKGVFVSLDIPEPFVKDTSIDYSDEQKVWVEKQINAYKERCAEPALIAQSNIPMGFSFIKVKPSEVAKHLKTCIQHDLSKEQVLKALTLGPAEILGIDHLVGSLEKGKVANMIVTDTVLFESNTNIVMNVINGDIFKYKAKKKSKKPSSSKVESYHGIWDFSVDVMGEENKGNLKFIDKNGIWEGFMRLEGSDYETLTNVELNEETMEFKGKLKSEGITFKGKLNLSGQRFSGTIKVFGLGGFTILGDKTSDNPDKN